MPTVAQTSCWLDCNNSRWFLSSAGIGCIVHDHTGSVLMAACKAYANLTEAYEAELLAVKEGLALALPYLDAPLLLQSDSAAVVAPPNL
jgi:hypothetical protein